MGRLPREAEILVARHLFIVVADATFLSRSHWRTSMTEKTPIETLPFEKALAELEDIVRRLERGDVPLEDSIAIYERGEVLKKHCETLLKKAEARIERITIGPDGNAAGKAPLDVE
jgi:exodeoxyribonuclease VII small subunit